MVELSAALAKSRNVVASDAALRKLRAEIGSVLGGVRKSVWLVMGDSTQAGRGAGTGAAGEIGARPKCPSAFAAAWLNANGIPARADGWMGDAHVNPLTTAHYTEYNPNVTLGANWSSGFNNALGGAAFQLASPNTNTIATTPERAADRFDVFWGGAGSTGTFTVTDVGGTLATINTLGAYQFGKTTAVRAAASTAVVNIQRSTGGTVYVEGVMPWNSTLAEVCLYNVAVAGWKVSDYLVATDVMSPYQQLSIVAANMNYIELGLNEVAGAVSMATFIANLGSLVDRCIAISGANSVILATPNPADITGAYYLPLAWRQAIASLALTKDVIFIDHFSRIVSYEADTSLYFDGAHPKAQIYSMKGRLVAGLALL
jgi:hypothetical protein